MPARILNQHFIDNATFNYFRSAIGFCEPLFRYLDFFFSSIRKLAIQYLNNSRPNKLILLYQNSLYGTFLCLRSEIHSELPFYTELYDLLLKAHTNIK